MLKNRWIQFAIFFVAVLAMRLAVLSELSIGRNILESFLFAAVIIWVGKFRAPPKAEKKKDT